MKRQTLLITGIVTTLLIGGGTFLYLNKETKPTTLSSYWNEKNGINQLDDTGNNPLINAVMAQDTAVVQYLIAHGANVDVANRDNISALSASALSGNSAIFDIIAPLSSTDFKRPKLLERAIEGGNPSIVKSILSRGGDANALLIFKGKKRADEEIDYKDHRVVTPLKKAISTQNADIIKVLLEAGAEGAEFFLTEEITRAKHPVIIALASHVSNLNTISVKGMDLLTYAIGSAEPETIRYLIDNNGGDINTSLQKLIITQSKSPYYTETVRLLLEKGAIPNPTLMELALKKKQTDVFKALTQCSATPNPLTTKNIHMLTHAIDKGHTDAVSLLLETGADIWETEKDDSTAVSTAVKNATKYPQIAQMIEAKLPNINDTGYNGETILMLYASAGNETEFLRLVEKGANIYQTDNSGKNMLMYAAEGGNIKIIEYLLHKNISISAKDNAEKNAIMYAAESGQNEAFRYLAGKKIRLIDQDFEGKTILMYAAEKSLPEIANIIINGGESVDTQDQKGRTALSYAAEKGNSPMVQRLVDAGGDINKSDNNGVTPLNYAAQNGNVNIIKTIISAGGDIYKSDYTGRVPAVHAMKQGNQNAFFALSDNFMGFHHSSKDNDKTYMMYAIEGGNAQIIRRGLEHIQSGINKKDRDGKTALMYLVLGNRADLLRELIRLNANAAARDNNGKTVLMYAAEGKVGVNLVTLMQIAWTETSSTINMRDNLGKTALMYAVSGKYTNATKQHVLLTHGENPEAVDNQKRTVLMYLVGNKEAKVEISMVEEMIKEIKNINQTDINGKTALMYAAENPSASVNIIEKMYSNKADITAKDNTGKTALMYAVESGDINKVRYLIYAGADKTAQTVNGKSVLDFASDKGSCYQNAVKELLEKK